MSAPMTSSMAFIAGRVLLPFACGYFMSYLFRSVNAVIAPNLQRDLGIGAGDLGTLTAAYFIAFAAFQLPLGILLDRFGPRRVQAVLLLSAALGAVVFAVGSGLSHLIIGRALIGLGVAGGLMAAMKAIALWLPKERWALANGVFMTAGGLGALAATLPVELALEHAHWTMLFWGLAGLTVLASLTIFFVVPERPRAAAAPTAGLGTQLRECGQFLALPAPEKGVRVEGGIPEIVVERAVQVVSARLDDDVHEAAARAPEFGRQDSGLQLEFPDRVNRWNPLRNTDGAGDVDGVDRAIHRYVSRRDRKSTV